MNDIDQIYATLGARDYADRLFADLPGQRKDGRWNIKAECPSCRGNDFSYSLEEPVYHCWNCGLGGDWLDYLQKHEGMDFKEALQRLAAEAGVELHGFDQTAYAQRRRQHDLLQAAQGIFCRDLFRPEGRAILDYLLHRGYTEEESRQMGLGAYIDRDRLVHELRQQGITQQEIDLSGLLTSGFGETHTLAMLWPDIAGRPIGLACRTLLSDEERAARTINEKYKFSYRLQKDQGLVGLTRAARLARATSPGGALIIVEGLLDALYLNTKGIPTVALGGTSLAPAQAQAIAATRLEQIILALDNDLPGQKGIAATIERLRPSGLQIFVARLPAGVKDPDELVRKYGTTAFIQACNSAEDWARWKARSLVAPFDLSADRGRDAALSQALSYYATIEDGIYRRTFREELTLATRLTASELEDRAQQYDAQATQQRAATMLRGLVRRLQEHVADNDLMGAELALRQSLGHLQQSRGTVHPEPYVLPDLIADLQHTTEGLVTGWQGLDRLIRIPAGAITLFAGRPGHGKTTVLLNLLLNLLERYPDHAFYLYSYEEARAMLGLKLIMLLAGKILHSEFNQEAYLGYLKGQRDTETAIERAKERFEEYTQSGRLWLQDRRLGAEDLAASIGSLRGQAGAVLIDYIQKVPLARPVSQRYLEVKETSALLLEQAVQTNIPIVVGAQLGRAQGAGQKVRLDNLREAGDLEQDAALVVGIYNASVDRVEDGGKEDSDPVVDLELSILKHRGGVAGRKAMLAFERATLRLRDRVTNGLY